MKICKRCNIPKELSEFCNRKGEHDGKHRYCKSCLNSEFKGYYQRSRKETGKEYYKKYREENKEYFRKQSHDHYHNNKEQYREWERNRLRTNPAFRIKKSIMALLNFHLRKNSSFKSKHTIEYLGCTIEYYVKYLESKFDKHMNWENYGSYWEIDHIKPIDLFNLNDPIQLNECFNYKNTQPMFWKENREKSNKF